MKNVLLFLSLALLGCPATPTDMTQDLKTTPTGDMAEVSCCGKPGDLPNNVGVGKYCREIVDCTGNMRAQICSSLGNTANRKTFFCTFLCDPKADGGNPCGDGAACTCDVGGAGCACTPVACSMNPNPPPGCTN